MSNVIPLTPRPSAKYYSVPPIPVKLLAEASKRLIGFRERHGTERMDVSYALGITMRGQRGTRPDDELMVLVDYLASRFHALLNHLADQGYSKQQTSSILHGRDMKILRAAARAPLIGHDLRVSDCRFDPTTFLRIVHEERPEEVAERAADS